MPSALEEPDRLGPDIGIGEHAGQIRERVCRQAGWVGLMLDEPRGPRISEAGARVSAWVLATNDNLMARHTRRLLGAEAMLGFLS